LTVLDYQRFWEISARMDKTELRTVIRFSEVFSISTFRNTGLPTSFEKGAEAAGSRARRSTSG
jgi:hypothetical protein